MINQKYDLLFLVDDKYIIESLPQRSNLKTNMMLHFRKKSYFKSLVSCILIICIVMLILCMSNTALAKSIPIINQVFSYVQDILDFSGPYSNYSTEIGSSVKSNGVIITLDELYYDGSSIYVSYIIKSEIPFFKNIDDIHDSQFQFETQTLLSSNDKTIRLDNWGTTGLVGHYLDEYTYVGADTYFLDINNYSISDQISLKINIDEVGSIFLNGSLPSPIKGKWTFDVTTSVNYENINEYIIGIENEGHRIDKVITSPIQISIFTSYPDIYRNTVHYQVLVYNDLNNDSHLGSFGLYDYTSGITRIPTTSVDEDIYIYVIDDRRLDKNKIDWCSQSEIASHAIISAHVKLQ